jgi:alpha-beta hydrolase superfamily lysophospholipase
MTASVYYLPGHGGQISTGLGAGLLSRGYDVSGRETTGEFRKLRFTEQMEIIAEDLQTAYWHEDARVVANSFGAYLFLNAQRLMAPYIGKVLLLSPIIGEFSSEEIRMGFIPPQAGKLMELADGGNYPTPKQCEIHVGEQDWQSDPKSVQLWAGRLGIATTIVPDAGHMLGKDYVSSILDRWLPERRDEGMHTPPLA